MIILTTPNWADYELLDTGDGFRLERFGKYILKRPDPQILWKPKLPKSDWEKASAIFENDKWKVKSKMPDKWIMEYKGLKFWVKLSPFKHTGIFPEQASQWDFISSVIAKSSMSLRSGESRRSNPSILNLFAYTGLASIACAKSGTKVTHLDASRPAIGWAKENQQLSGLPEDSIRWILDDAIKFTAREIKRGIKYDGIIMDPPIYGHGPDGEIWDFNKDFPKLLENCQQILSDKPLFIIINAYAISSSAIMLENMLQDLNLDGKIESGELALQENNDGRLLSTGIFARWSMID
ncbi:MAG: class I SAM-dependent methyltransferase [Candidatus Daviesbacteria bacterium]|nr:class I SAM-dependent methyltransferase [Candidatus Daviesbacteria bacterium]